MMENDKCKITLNENNTYYSGSVISGQISINCTKPKKIRGIYFKILGYGKCSWSDTVSSSQEKDHSATFTASEDYLSSIVYIVGSKNGPPFELQRGPFSRSFQFQLKQILPSSFKGHYGKIKYKLIVTIDKPWNFDEIYTIPLTIIRSYDLNFDPVARLPKEQQLTRNIGFISSGPISLIGNLKKIGYTANQGIPVTIELVNNSSTNVDKIKVTLHQIVNYNSQLPMRAVKEEHFKILRKELNGAEKKSTEKYECILDLPQNLPSTDLNYNQIINISYEIKIEAKLTGLYKNLMIKLPITIGTIDFRDVNPTLYPNLSIGFSSPQTIPISARPPLQQPQMPVVPPLHALNTAQIGMPLYNYNQSPYAQPSAPIASVPVPLVPPPSAPSLLDTTYHSNDYSSSFMSMHSNVSMNSSYNSNIDVAPPSYQELFGSTSPTNSTNNTQLQYTPQHRRQNDMESSLNSLTSMDSSVSSRRSMFSDSSVSDYRMIESMSSLTITSQSDLPQSPVQHQQQQDEQQPTSSQQLSQQPPQPAPRKRNNSKDGRNMLLAS